MAQTTISFTAYQLLLDCGPGISRILEKLQFKTYKPHLFYIPSLGIGSPEVFKIHVNPGISIAETGCKIQELTKEHQKDLWICHLECLTV
jgi:hypothetical protein